MGVSRVFEQIKDIKDDLKVFQMCLRVFQGWLMGVLKVFECFFN